MKKISITSLFGIILLVLTTLPAMAVPFSFSRITSNAPTDIAAQLTLDVTGSTIFTESGDVFASVLFAVRNDGSIDGGARIHEVYWDFTTSDLLTNMIMPTGWSSPANPDNLPGGNEISPNFTADIGADNGPGDFPDVTEVFQFDGIFDDVITALNDGSLRVGLHVGGIDGSLDESDSFATGSPPPPSNPVPEPSTVILLGSGLLGLVYLRKRKN